MYHRLFNHFIQVMKKIITVITLLLAVIVVNAKKNDQQGVLMEFTPLQKLGYAERLIESFYVDTVDAPAMVEEAITAMLKTLDPHSTYTNREETTELTTPLQGNFSGIGIQFNMVNDSLYVIQTTVGGPSERVGILPGDRILSANDSILSGANRKNSDILNILRGPKGTEVIVEVQRKGEQLPIMFRIIRDDIPLYSVDAAYRVGDSAAYVKVSRFAESTGREVADYLNKFKAEGVKDVIIDLQDNGGGYLNSAVELSSLFLPKGEMIVYTDGPRIDRTDYTVESSPLFPDGRLIVLVNQYSASSSEIFSGAIQDNDRGLVVGRRTFGKGLVQRPFPFPDGSMIRLTVSKYYTPSGRSIQKPFEKGDNDDYFMDIYNRYKNGELQNADSVHFDPQLEVFTLRNHRPVYGGGGIMPDMFVAVDTSGYSNYYRDVIAKGLLNQFVVRHLDDNRSRLLEQYPESKLFVDNYVVSPELLESFTAFAQHEGVAMNDEEFAKSREVIQTILKGLIARDLFDSSAYFMVVNPSLNTIYRRAIELLDNKARYNELLGLSSL